jgi:hypothetical protein
MSRLLRIGLLSCALVAGVTAQGDSRSDAKRMQVKLVSIIERGIDKPGKRQKVQTTAFTDREVNAYFQQYGADLFPTGVKDAQVAIADGGRVQARAMVALDQALKTKQRSWLDPLAWVTGTLEVAATGTLTADNGQGRFALDQATLGGVPIPKTLLQELVTYYSASSTHPKGFDLDAPFELPVKIHSVQTTRGTATVVQR